MKVSLRQLAEAAAIDPAKPLLEAAGDLSDYEVFHNLVLVATYVAPAKIGSIIMPDKVLDEGRYQGKVGLVLKVGPTAFKDDSVAKFGGVSIRAGDWVVYRPSDGFEMFIRDRRAVNDGLSVRLVEDVFIRGRVSDPSLIY